jgi:FrmR/RcnR family transcriptional regulator, repressor of frmRAB operon
MQERKMAEPIEDRQKLINRVRRLAGQIEALERAVENDAGFTEVMRLLTAGRGAMNSIMAEVVEDHIQAHMLGRDRKPSRDEIEAAEELLDVLRSYIK